MQKFKKLLQDFGELHPEKDSEVQKCLDLLEKYRDDETRPFYRDCFDDGHFTGSVLVLNKDKTRVLLMHHLKLDKWSQFGGHADGDTDIRRVALRELEEESGITENDIDVSPHILNIDVHPMIAKKGEPEHIHYDISFLALVDEDIIFQKQEIEVGEIRWFDLKEVMKNLDSGKYVSGFISMVKNT